MSPQDVHGFTGGLYQVLGVSPEDSQEAIVHAYRRQARASHPDAHPVDSDGAARFRVLTAAYEVLSDPVRRAAYDRASTRVSASTVQSAGGRPPAIALHRPAPGPSRSQLWAGPVRMEPLGGESAIGLLWPQPPWRELPEGFALLLGFLSDGWAK